MIELPICCMDSRETPPRRLTITYETDFMLPPQEQVLELHGQVEKCEDCAIVWEVSYGPGIVDPGCGSKTKLIMPEKQETWVWVPVSRTVVDVYCIDQHLQSLVIYSQYWAYSVWERYLTDRWWWGIIGLAPPEACLLSIWTKIDIYNCHGTVVLERPGDSAARSKEGITEKECEEWYKEVKRSVIEEMAEKRKYLWKIPRDYRDPRAIALGCKGYGE